VSYTPPTATDEDSAETPTVGCLPASGSTFAIATTTVTCTVSDSDDSNSPVSASFTVTVNGALAQLQDPLLPDVKAMPASLGRLILANDVNGMINNLQHGNTVQVCSDLSFMGLVVQEWSGALMTTAQADTILADVNRIGAVLGCNADSG
jgi:HYR domain